MAPDGGFNTSNFVFNPSEELYYSYAIRWTSTNVVSGSATVLKYGRINSSPNRYNGPGNFAFSSGGALTGAGSYFFAESGSGGYIFQQYATVSKDQWHRVEMYEKLSSPAGSANGINWFSLDGNIWNRTEQINRAADQNFQLDNIILGLMCANISAPETVSMWVDDVYVDNTRARVEIGNASVWSNCTIRNIQIPTIWETETGHIKVDLNRGSFTSGSTAYLYVINRDGDVNNQGYPITIGSSDNSGEINPPTTEEPDPAIPEQDPNTTSVWNAVASTGDTTWKNSSVAYCVRLLVPGSEISNSGNKIKLGFMGRNSGNYIIQRVSIAERDISSSVGNVIDSTWTRITFDKQGISEWAPKMS